MAATPADFLLLLACVWSGLLAGFLLAAFLLCRRPPEGEHDPY